MVLITSKETSDRSGVTNKRKGPPEFRHLPRDRAKKLKQQWIEKKKIKSQWRQEKKKQNIIITRPTSTTTEPQLIDQAVSSNSTAKDSTGDSDSSDSKLTSLPKMGSYKKLKRKEPEVVAETSGKVSEKAPQIDRTSTTSQRTTTSITNRKHQNTGFQSKKEVFIGKRQQRRPVTMREKMGSLLEKIQKSHAQGQ